MRTDELATEVAWRTKCLIRSTELCGAQAL